MTKGNLYKKLTTLSLLETVEDGDLVLGLPGLCFKISGWTSEQKHLFFTRELCDTFLRNTIPYKIKK